MNTPNSNARVCQGNILKAVMLKALAESSTSLSKKINTDFHKPAQRYDIVKYKSSS